jgi:hypothetical protein
MGIMSQPALQSIAAPAVLSDEQVVDARIGREVRRLYLFDGPRCDRIVESVLDRLRLER